MTTSFDWTPDVDKVSNVFGFRAFSKGLDRKVLRQFKDGSEKGGEVPLEQLRLEFPNLRQIDIDLFYHPGNPNIRQWAYLELHFETNTGSLVVHGDYQCFARVMDVYIESLGLVKTAAEQLRERIDALKAVLLPALFTQIRGSLRDGNFAASLSAAVVFVEDRLRGKVGTAGQGLTGADLALVAFKNPGVLAPPLSFANNAEDNAYLLLRGWIGLVRNLHGHHSSIPMGLDEASAQLLGVNYLLWIVENSTRK